MKNGTVYLVGAGPGDYKLITVRGLECIKNADVIIYDRLADDRLLEFRRPAAELIYVGKNAHQHTLPQDEINRLLIARAGAGRTVVRLKGGDPFVFGRGGEEALALVRAGIPFAVVPGVTAAVAVPAYAGIPVTHRTVAASWAVVTGHEDPAKLTSAVKWDKLAAGVDTLVVLMGVENLAVIAEKLIKYGRPAATPAALISWGTKPEQTVVVAELADIAAAAGRQGIEPPAVLIVGEVVRLRDQLNWFERKPLFGKTVLVTRARAQAGVLTARLAELGARCWEAPAIKIVPPPDYTVIDTAMGNLTAYTWLIFTSVNGVDGFFARLHAQGRDARAFGGLKIAALGGPTAGRLREQGIIPDIVPVEFRAEGVVEALAGKVGAGDRVLIPRALAARELLAVELRRAGAEVEVAPVYQTVAGETDGRPLAEKLAAGQIDIVTFTSSSTVTKLLELLGPGGSELVNRAQVVCIGPVTAVTCLDHGIEPAQVADEFTIAGLVAAVVKIGGGEVKL